MDSKLIRDIIMNSSHYNFINIDKVMELVEGLEDIKDCNLDEVDINSVVLTYSKGHSKKIVVIARGYDGKLEVSDVYDIYDEQ